MTILRQMFSYRDLVFRLKGVQSQSWESEIKIFIYKKILFVFWIWKISVGLIEMNINAVVCHWSLLCHPQWFQMRYNITKLLSAPSGCACVPVIHSGLSHQQSDSRWADICHPVGSRGSHWPLAAFPDLPIGCLHSEAGYVPAESGHGFGLFWTHPERPQRGHRDHGHPTGCPGVHLHPIGRRDFEWLWCGCSNSSPGRAGEDPGETAERDGEVEQDRGVKWTWHVYMMKYCWNFKGGTFLHFWCFL